MSKVVGSLNGTRLVWEPGDSEPHLEGSDKHLEGLPLTYPEAFSGIPPLTAEGQIGAIAHWGAVFALFPDGTWRANSSCGTWRLS